MSIEIPSTMRQIPNNTQIAILKIPSKKFGSLEYIWSLKFVIWSLRKLALAHKYRYLPCSLRYGIARGIGPAHYRFYHVGEQFLNGVVVHLVP